MKKSKKCYFHRICFLAFLLFLRSNSEPSKIECFYNWVPSTVAYHCIVRNQTVVDDDQQKFVITGNHWLGNINTTVTAIEIQNTANIPFIIAELFSQFENAFRMLVMPSGLTRIQSNAFRNAQNLRILTIEGNPLQVIQSDAFVGADSLTTLEIRDSALMRLHSTSFRGLVNLRNLAVQNSLIRRFPANIFYTLKNLESINLSDNQIDLIDGELFVENRNLREINLMRNQILEIGTAVIDGLDDLEIFNIIRNRCANDIWFSSESNSLQQVIRKGLTTCFENFESLKSFRVEIRGKAKISDDYGNEILSI